MSYLKTILKSAKPFLGKINVEIDRTRQMIYFEKNGQTQTLTVNQLFDEIESIFSKAKKPTARLAGETVNPAVNRPSWLPDCGKPVINPLVFNNQSLIKPARPLAASQTEENRLS